MTEQAKRVEELLIRAQYKTMHNSIPQDKLLRLCLAQLRLVQIQSDNNWAIPVSVEDALWEDVQNAMRAI